MRIGKIGVAVIGLVPFNVYGECTPTPDCASIGYTETSCEGDYLACPFDSTKLKCIPCDSSYRYNCSGDNITGGTGSACGGKYVSCECELLGAVFKNGSCICDTSCSVGNIYYSDGSCSSCADSTKTAIGVVVKDNELIMSRIKSLSIMWASEYEDVAGIIETSDSSIVKADFNGKINTIAIVETYTNDTMDNNAAVYCNSYFTDGTSAGEWYLPALGELYHYVYGNNTILQNTLANVLAWNSYFNYSFWSSSEASTHNAWSVYSNNGKLGNITKNVSKSIICFLAID